MNKLFSIAKIVVDVPGLGVLDYAIAPGMEVKVGQRVWVNLRGRGEAGIVVDLAEQPDCDPKKIKTIETVLDTCEPLNEAWLALTQFCARYYIRSWGEVALSCLPPSLKKPLTPRQLTWFEKRRQQPRVKKIKSDTPHKLNSQQQSVVKALSAQQGFHVNVLFGVTGSGKTEVYMQWMANVLAKNPQAQILLLVPEINLTPALENRIRARFPDSGVYTMHSELSDGERLRSWLAAHENRARILVGTRLSIFASLPHLSAIIVDEEHDLSYKAHDGSRFSARDLAIWRAKYQNCPIVLGSATPSLETWGHIKTGKYHCWTLDQRAVPGSDLPDLLKVPLAAFNARHPFHDITLGAMRQALARGEQILVFVNRRGYSPQVMCQACGWVGACQHCTSKTVFHKRERAMICHHCGTRYPVPVCCPDCGNQDLTPLGIGTERLEEALSELFADKTIMRIDRDAITTKAKADEAFGAMHEGKVDILVGTQMIAKGHDFKRVGLVVILNADAGIMSYDPRAKERLFATLMQVSGRAGRHLERGQVIVQTAFAQEPLFVDLAKQDYKTFADREWTERQTLMAPPVVHQALLMAKDHQVDKALAFLQQVKAIYSSYASHFPEVFVYDPVPMGMMKLQGLERAQLLIEATDRKALNQFLWWWVGQFKLCDAADWQLEVDPVFI